MHYVVYETTNNVNGKIYVGSHKTKDLNDGYLGSGKTLRSAIKKYGAESFSRRIIKACGTAEEMYALEAEIVNLEFVRRDDTYNIKVGGFGGFDYINERGMSHKFTDADRKQANMASSKRFEAAFLSRGHKCLECDTPFSWEAYRKGRGTGERKFCSRSCCAKHYNRARRELNET